MFFDRQASGLAGGTVFSNIELLRMASRRTNLSFGLRGYLLALGGKVISLRVTTGAT